MSGRRRRLGAGRSTLDRRWAWSLPLSLALAVACADGVRKAPREMAGVARLQRGLASWYGKPYHGRPTASGETFDMHQLTAAHPTLPFGTVVRVVNLENGRRVEVRINDRGPFKKGRIIDLSYAAASKLRMIRRGVVRVELVVVRGP